jgi:tRNA threonylcarbamoyl adenosine modification protein (Sua5/YciO/YrdC/YwlC family)
MARYFDIHPDNPQRRSLAQIADIVREGGVIAYPTDSCYALGCQLGNTDGFARIRSIRQLDDRHHLTLMCRDFAQLGQFVVIPNSIFRAIKAATPGSYTFILPASKEVPRRLQHPGKKTVGVRIPRHVATQALLAELGEPLVTSTLLLPGHEEPMTQGWEKSITVVGSVPQSPESMTASTAFSSSSAISQPWVIGSSWPGSSSVLVTRGSPSSASSAWVATWRGIRTPTVFLPGCCSRRGTSLVAGRMKV